jgi:hypothetical protein
MHRYALYGTTVDSAIELPATVAAATGVAECTVSFVDAGPVVDVEWFHAWRFPRSAPSLLFGRMSGTYVLRVPDVADFTVSADGTAVGIPRSPEPAIDDVKRLLADLVLPLAASRRRDLLLHAAAVHLPEIGAVALAGASGRGKSSLALALAARGASVLSDDCTAIDQTAASVVALPAYPGIRMWCGGQREKTRVVGSTVPFRNQPSRLTGILVLSRRHHGEGLRARRITPHFAVVELFRHAFLMDIEDRVQLGRVFDALTGLVSRVPILRLSLPDDRASLPEAAASTMELVQALVRTRQAVSAA